MFVISGCGRSGTGYIYSRLKSAGIQCGHENVFTSNGFVGWNNYKGDSSWYAAPFLHECDSLKVVHIVRNPEDVIHSFYRIGVFSKFGWVNFIIDPTPVAFFKRYFFKPTKVKKRLEHVKSIRHLIREYTSALDSGTEIEKINKYWYEWNTIVERSQEWLKGNYLRINLEDLDDKWPDLLNHIGYSSVDLSEGEPVNKKKSYTRKPPNEIKLSNEVRQLAKKYGYDY